MSTEPDTPPAKPNLTIVEVAALWGVSRRTVRRRVAAGRLPFRKVGHFTYFSREDAEALAPPPKQDAAQPASA
jgi:excisionase family DNA binding protein